MPMWKGLILLGLLLVGCSSDPAVSQATHDRAVAELRAEIHAARDLLKDQTAINTSLTEKNEELDTALAASQKEAVGLEKKIDTLSQDISDLKQALIDNKSIRPKVIPKDVYSDVLARAAEVDWFSPKELAKCPLISTFDVTEKQPTAVEVWFAAREDGLESPVNERYEARLHTTYYVEKEYKEGPNEDIEVTRILDNPWNSSSDPFVTILYKGDVKTFRIRQELDTRSDFNLETLKYFVKLSGGPDWGRPQLDMYCTSPLDENNISAYKDNIVDGSFIVAWYVD